MIENPSLGIQQEFSYHEELEIGINVSVFVPSALTETLKITVLDELKGENGLKKCAPYIILPKSAVSEVDNSSEYVNITMLLCMQIKGENFALPIEGCNGQRQSKKEMKRNIPLSPDQKVVLFPKAKMPNAYLKQELERHGVNHLTFMFLVDNKLIRDRIRKEAEINTNNTQGIGQTKIKQTQSYEDHLKQITMPTIPTIILFDHSALNSSTLDLPLNSPNMEIINCNSKKRKISTISGKTREEIESDIYKKITYLIDDLSHLNVEEFLSSLSIVQLQQLDEYIIAPLVLRQTTADNWFREVTTSVTLPYLPE